LTEGTNLPEFAKDIRRRVSETYTTMSEGRARTIARTETTVASGEASRSAAKSLNIPNLLKEWVPADDTRVRGSDPAKATSNHARMSGVKVPLDEKFSVPSDDGPDQMSGPGDPSAPIDQLANCRCVETYSTPNEKGMNLSGSAKRAYARAAFRKRASLERGFKVQLSRAFRKEARAVLAELAGVTDRAAAESAIARAQRESAPIFEKAYRVSMTSIMSEIGGDILKLRS
jgi:hypothetical protein